MSVYPSILVGLVSARDENLLVILDLDDVFPAAGETVGTGNVSRFIGRFLLLLSTI
jgi:hypothetical protein